MLKESALKYYESNRFPDGSVYLREYGRRSRGKRCSDEHRSEKEESMDRENIEKLTQKMQESGAQILNQVEPIYVALFRYRGDMASKLAALKTSTRKEDWLHNPYASSMPEEQYLHKLNMTLRIGRVEISPRYSGEHRYMSSFSVERHGYINSLSTFPLYTGGDDFSEATAWQISQLMFRWKYAAFELIEEYLTSDPEIVKSFLQGVEVLNSQKMSAEYGNKRLEKERDNLTETVAERDKEIVGLKERLKSGEDTVSRAASDLKKTKNFLGESKTLRGIRERLEAWLSGNENKYPGIQQIGRASCRERV